MIAQAGSAPVEMALLAPNQAQHQNPVTLKNDPTTEETPEFQMLGDDGLSFWDFLDIINPLQHIPVISTLYRSITGDEIDPAAKIAGGTLYGGPIGAVSSLSDVAIDYGTGKDIGEHAMALINEEPSPVESAGSGSYQSFAAPSSNPYLARAGFTESAPLNSATTSSYAPPATIVTQDLAQSAGMSGIPRAKQTYADQIAAYRPMKNKAAVAPDLGMLGDIKHLEQAGLVAKQPAKPSTSKPLDLSPRYSVGPQKGINHQESNPELKMRLKKADAAYQNLTKVNDGWLVNSIMSGMDGLEKMAPKTTGSKAEISANLH